MADTLMTLFCIVDGEATSSAFSIKIPPNDNVDDLKNLIKTKKTPEFEDVAADKLTLWKVSIPIIDGNEIPILLDDFNKEDKKKLGPATRLSKVFLEGLPEETVNIIVQRPPPAADQNAPISFKVKIEGDLPQTFEWRTIPSEASLADLCDQIRVKCGITDKERRSITIRHRESFSQGPIDEDVEELRLRSILKLYVLEGLRDLVVRVAFPQIGFSKFTSLDDIRPRLGINKFEDFPVYSTPCDTDDHRAVLQELKGAINLARRSIPFANEACHTRYIGPFFMAAVALFPELCLIPEREISGRWGKGPLDYAIELKNEAGFYVLGVAEAKQTSTLKSGFPQNVIQLDAALTGCDQRGPRSQSRPLVSYGIVTDAIKWEFVQCQLAPMNAAGTYQPPPVIRRSRPLVEVDYEAADWGEKVQKVFEHILWLVGEM
ncbi:hypothetical protein BGZ81_002492, partial [Podila clonocystis]